METAYFHADDVLVAASPRRCFELVRAIRRYAEWWRRVRCEPLGTEAVLEVGSRFRFRGGPVSWIIEVKDLRPHRRIDLEYVDGDLLGPVAWEFFPEGKGTRVRYVYRGVRPNTAYTRASFESGRGLRLHVDVMQSDAFAGLRRVLESGLDTTGGDLFSTLLTQRAVRRFRPDPVPDAVLREVLSAATRAPSARNAQPWVFVAVREPETRARIARLYEGLWDRAQEYTAASGADADVAGRPGYGAMMQSVDHLARHLAEVPVLVLAGLDTRALGPLADAEGRIRSHAAAYASIYPAVQNLMLAARGLGLGTTLTTLALGAEHELRAIVGLPAHVHVPALIPLGYPEGPFQRTRRRPLDEVAFGERWRSSLGER